MEARCCRATKRIERKHCDDNAHILTLQEDILNKVV